MAAIAPVAFGLSVLAIPTTTVFWLWSNHHRHHHHSRDTTDTAYPALIMYNASITDVKTVVALGGMNVSVAANVSDDHATFSFQNGTVAGLLSGFPGVGRHGIMQGGLNFAVDGMPNITGTWISVVESVADEATKDAFRFLTDLTRDVDAKHMMAEYVEVGAQLVDMALDDILEMTKEVLALVED